MPPRLSIVVPVHNVELYLDACLESLATQTFEDFEVVLLDDGSVDASAAIAKNFTERDSRFRLVQQANQGLGQARNAGAREISPDSEYLAFVDSDDILPPDAYRLMVRTLDETGSDFAAGNVLRFRSVGSHQSWGHRTAFATTRLRTHISRFKPLITDRTAWNKVYRRTFWDRHGFAYPEGILYEDAPVSIPAHYLASSVDVLGDVVYHWRVRETGERSITQRSTDPRSLTDRVTSIRLVRAALRARPGPEFARYLCDYDHNVLTEELPLIYKYVPDGADDFRAAFVRDVGALVREIGTGAWAELTVPEKLKAYFAREGRIQDFLALLEHQRKNWYGIPVKGLTEPKADYPFLSGRPEVPPSLLRLSHRELKMRSQLEEVAWTRGKLLLKGWAFVDQLGAEHRLRARKKLVFRESETKRKVVLRARTTTAPEATVSTGQALRSADLAGFTAVLDPSLLQQDGAWRDGIWEAFVVVKDLTVPYQARLLGGDHGSAQTPPAHWVAPDVRMLPSATGSGFRLRIETVRARVLDVQALDEATLAVHGELARDPGEGAALRAEHHTTKDVLTFPLEIGAAGQGTGRTVAGGVPFTARVPLADLASVPAATPSAGQWRPEPWLLSVLKGDGKRLALAHDERGGFSGLAVPLPGPDEHRAVYVKRTPSGYLQFSMQPPPPLVDCATADAEGTLTLGGVFPLAAQGGLPSGESAEPSYELVLHNWRGEEYSYPIHAAGGRFEAVFRPVPPEPYAGATTLPAGRWWPSVRPVSEGGRTAGLLGVDRGTPVQIGERTRAAPPTRFTVRGRGMHLASRYHDRLAIVSEPLLAPLDRSRFGQRTGRDELYPAARRARLRDAVVYDVFGGLGYGDSPRAVHEELVRRGEPLEHIWLVRDGRTEVPPTARPVQHGSLEAFELLGRARYFVTNSAVPGWFERRAGQTVLQTWHGTPLKQIGHDYLHDYYTSPQVLADLAHDSAQWSLLASPSSFATPVLTRALGYRGEVLESGAPRTDALLAPDPARIAEVRRRLGLPEGKKVVLYAPTWRENRQLFNGGYQLDLRIDLDQARHELAADHVLLVRGHHKVTEQLRDGVRDGFVRDVTRWPDATDLLLVADVLISDYAALICDFALTDRPILLYTHDLEHYRDTLRGFSCDFEAKAPGPLLRDAWSLVVAVRAADRLAEEYAPARAAFRAEFCDLDDGGATGRVVQRMLGGR